MIGGQTLRTREPNGRHQRQPKAYSPAEVRRLRDAAMAGLRSPEWGTELGRLYLTEAITGGLYAAGKRWAEEAARYRGAIDVRPVRSASLERGIGGEEPDPDSYDGRQRARRDARAVEKFDAAHKVLTMAGLLAESVVRRVCEDNLTLAGAHELKSLIHGLSKLAEHYTLTKSRK